MNFSRGFSIENKLNIEELKKHVLEINNSVPEEIVQFFYEDDERNRTYITTSEQLNDLLLSILENLDLGKRIFYLFYRLNNFSKFLVTQKMSFYIRYEFKCNSDTNILLTVRNLCKPYNSTSFSIKYPMKYNDILNTVCERLKVSKVDRLFGYLKNKSDNTKLDKYYIVDDDSLNSLYEIYIETNPKDHMVLSIE